MPTNSSSTATKRYQENVPNTIREKIDLLHRQEQLITTIEAQLIELRSQHERLEEELEPYRIHSATQVTAVTFAHDTRCFIHRLPNELLLLMFELVIHDVSLYFEHHRFNLGKVLQICKRWYNLVMHSPSLWARIQIANVMRFVGVQGQQPPIRYIEACLLRSQGLPLDIELNFTALDANNYIKAELFAYAEALVDEEESDPIFEQIHNQEWIFDSSVFQVKFDQFLHFLFGEDGQHPGRWQTLTISLPQEEDFADLIWLRMAPTMTNLTSVEIFEAPSSWSDGEVLAEADLSNVNTLKIRGVHDKDNFTAHLLGASFSALISLDIGVGNTITNLEGLSSLQQLRSLTLECSGLPYQMDQNSVSPLFSLHLPRLNQLTLEGNYTHLRKIHFEFPALQTLSVLVQNEHQRLPALSPSSIEWRFGYRVRNMVDPINLVSLIRDVLLLSRETCRITIPEAEKAEFLEQIKQCRVQAAKDSLSEIVVEAHGRDPEIIDVSNLV